MCGTSVPAVSALCTLVLLEAKPDPGPTRATGGLPRIGRLTMFCPTHRARRPRLASPHESRQRNRYISTDLSCLSVCPACVHCSCLFKSFIPLYQPVGE